MPMREIEQKFTRSELFMVAWRSAEQAAALKQGQADARSTSGLPDGTNAEPLHVVDGKIAALEEKFGDDLCKRMTNDKNELDLRKVTGDEALMIMGAIGVQTYGRILR